MRDRTARMARTALAAGAIVLATVQSLAARPAYGQLAPADWRARLLRTARATTFGAARGPVADPTVPRGFSTAGLPDVTFAPATGRRRGETGIAGRITSRSAYPRLGIPRGVSYLWVVPRAPTRMAIVPADEAQRAHWLTTAPHGTFVGSGGGTTGGASSSLPCPDNSIITQLGTRRPPGGARLLMGACTCVDGKWMHAEEYGDELTRANVGVLLAR